MQNGEVQIGLICSEKQAIDATLKSLAAEDPRFCTVADKYWNARGGSSSNGGSFIFSIKDDPNSPTGKTLTCVDKFGNPVTTPEGQTHCDVSLPGPRHWQGQIPKSALQGRTARRRHRSGTCRTGTVGKLAAAALKKLKAWDYDALRRFCNDLVAQANAKDALREPAIATLTALIDTPCHTGAKKRSSVLQILHIALHEIFNALPPIESTVKSTYKRIAWKNRKKLRKPARGEKTPRHRRRRLRARARRPRLQADGRRRSGSAGRTSSPTTWSGSASTGSASGRTPPACASTSTTAPATTRPPASTGWRCTSTATRRTSSARS